MSQGFPDTRQTSRFNSTLNASQEGDGVLTGQTMLNIKQTYRTKPSSVVTSRYRQTSRDQRSLYEEKLSDTEVKDLLNDIIRHKKVKDKSLIQDGPNLAQLLSPNQNFVEQKM